MSRSCQKIIIAAGVSALVNCLVGHLADWCLFDVLGLPCPGSRN